MLHNAFTPIVRQPARFLGLLLAFAALSACSSTTAQGPGSTAVVEMPARLDHYAGMPRVPAFAVTSSDLTDGEPMPTPQRSGVFGVVGGQDLSPQLIWSGFPARTRSFVVTMYDGDAATGSGFWHWAVVDLPATTTSLPTGAGSPGSVRLPPGAVQLPNDAGMARYIGAAPPAGDVTHHYFFTVYALDVSTADVPDTASPALLGSRIGPHTIARASLVAIAKG